MSTKTTVKKPIIYKFRTGENYDKVTEFDLNIISFKMLDKTTPLLTEIDELIKVDPTKYGLDTFTDKVKNVDAEAKLGMDILNGVVNASTLTNVVSRMSTEDRTEILNLWAELFKTTIKFTNKNKQFEEDMTSSDNDFWFSQAADDLESAWNLFRGEVPGNTK